MLERHVVMQRTRSPGFQWWLKNVNEERISSEKLKIKHPYWFSSGLYQLQTNIFSNPRCQASASVFWRTKKVQIWFWECYFSAICLLWDARIPSRQSVGSEKAGGNKEICLFLLVVSNAYQEYLLWKALGPLWSVWTSTGSTHLHQQCWYLRGGDRPWLGGSISLVSVPWRDGEALFPSHNALPKAAATLLNFTNWCVVREGGIAALARFHKFQVQIEDSSLTGFSHPHPICLEVEGRWVDASTDCSVPHLAWKLFWSLLKEGPDQSELCVFSGVLWDKGWSEVDTFIPGGFIPLLLRGGTGNDYQRGLKSDQRCIPTD